MKKLEYFFMLVAFICCGVSIGLNMYNGISSWVWQGVGMTWVFVSFMKEKTIRILNDRIDEKP